MLTVFRSTITDILKKRNTIFVLFFGILFFLIGYGLKFSVSSGAADLSHYGKLVALHVFIFLFYIVAAVIASSDMETEISNGFIDLSLLSVSRIKFFIGKFAAYCVGLLFILQIIAIFGVAFSRLLLGVPINGNILLGFLGLGVNIVFLMVLVFIFILWHNLKGSSYFAFFACVLLSLMNSNAVMKWLVHSASIADGISRISPAFFKVQNEFIRIGFGFGFSNDVFVVFLNLSIYLVILFLILYRMAKKYESLGE